jgi:hypothetical protein
MLTTYLLRRDAEPSQPLARFIERVEALGPELRLAVSPRL